MGESTVNNGFPERLRAAMTARSLSQTALGKLCGAGQTAVWQWLGGTRPKPHTLHALAEALQVRVEWLASGQGKMDSPPAPVIEMKREDLESIAESLAKAAGHIADCAKLLKGGKSKE